MLQALFKNGVLLLLRRQRSIRACWLPGRHRTSVADICCNGLVRVLGWVHLFFVYLQLGLLVVFIKLPLPDEAPPMAVDDIENGQDVCQKVRQQDHQHDRRVARGDL